MVDVDETVQRMQQRIRTARSRLDALDPDDDAYADAYTVLRRTTDDLLAFEPRIPALRDIPHRERSARRLRTYSCVLTLGLTVLTAGATPLLRWFSPWWLALIAPQVLSAAATLRRASRLGVGHYTHVKAATVRLAAGVVTLITVLDVLPSLLFCVAGTVLAAVLWLTGASWAATARALDAAGARA